jgi:predicted TIM-barrel fold metal-dependent hydrolase
VVSPVFLEAPAIPDYDKASYIRNMGRLTDLMDRFRSIPWVLVTGPPVRLFGLSRKWDFSDEVMTAYRHDNLWLEVMFPITWGGTWDYPYPEAQAVIKDMRDKFGASKLIWGSDMPNVERFCTYTQSADYVRRYCSFLSAEEKDKILGANLDAMFKVRERLIAHGVA